MRCGALAIVLLAACGSTTPPPGAIGNAAPDAGPRLIPPLAAGCPAAFAEATGSCDWNVSPSNCQWAEGQCHCGVAQVCSGAVRDPAESENEPTTWQCASWPPAVRDDGCPGEIGGRCGDEGKQCVYGDCCVATYTCVGGEWQQTAADCPP